MRRGRKKVEGEGTKKNVTSIWVISPRPNQRFMCSLWVWCTCLGPHAPLGLWGVFFIKQRERIAIKWSCPITLCLSKNSSLGIYKVPFGMANNLILSSQLCDEKLPFYILSRYTLLHKIFDYSKEIVLGTLSTFGSHLYPFVFDWCIPFHL